MTKRLGSTHFKELLPNSIADDPIILSAAEALNKVLDNSIKSIPNILVFARLANDSKFINPVPMLAPMIRLAELAGGLEVLPTEILDLLAWQLHVESYDAAISLQAKREMIQASLLLHRRHGTPWSVRHAMETLLRIPTIIRQWFEYGGDPYFFRVRLNISGVYVDLRWLLSAFQIVMDYKNVRSWLEWLETFSSTSMNLKTGIGVSSNTSAYVDMYAPVTPLLIYRGVAMQSHTQALLKNYAPMPDLQIFRGTANRTTTRMEFVVYRCGRYALHEHRTIFGLSSRTCAVIQSCH